MADTRTETFLDGRLVKITEQVEVPDFAGPPFATLEEAQAAKAEPLPGMAVNVPVVDGAWRWELDGAPIADETAQSLLA